MTPTAPSTTAPATGTAVPAPRPAAEQGTVLHRQRPPAQYWDVFEACWRTAERRRA